MPYKDLEKRRAAWRESKRKRKQESSTPAVTSTPSLPTPTAPISAQVKRLDARDLMTAFAKAQLRCGYSGGGKWRAVCPICRGWGTLAFMCLPNGMIEKMDCSDGCQAKDILEVLGLTAHEFS